MNDIENSDIDELSLRRMLKLIHIHTGITMAENKKSLLQGRLRRRMRELEFSEYKAYLDHLESNKFEVQHFVNLVTTNETLFFRTNRVWDFLRESYLPEWFAANAKKTLNIWSAASSTGEEVYSIGISCQEFKNKNPDFDYQINGTDIDTQVLSIAEKGEYRGRSFERFKSEQPDLFEKYMKPWEDGYRISQEIQKKVKFNQHNLFKTPPLKEHYDLVFLRNVLIYFVAEDQEKVLTNVNLSLVKNGLLVIGESESLNSLRTPFRFKAPLIYQRTGS